MKPLFQALAPLVLLLGTSVSCVAQTPAPNEYTNRDKFGLNLAGVTDWTTEQPFADLFKTSRVWISQQKGQPFGKGPTLETNERGEVLRLSEDGFAETPLLTEMGPNAPRGDYVLEYEGEGTLAFSPPVQETSRAPGRIVFRPSEKNGQFFLGLRKLNPDNPIRNIRIWMPEHEKKQEVFYGPFMEFVRPFGTLRFMDWAKTNNSSLSKWSERPLLTDSRYSTKNGVPVEVMIDLANAQGADPWFCMPHLADDEFVREYAKLVKTRLKPDRKVYVEYSNEVWNSQFQQTKYAEKRGTEANLSDKPWQAGWRFYSQRTVEIGRIWKDVFGDQKSRLVIVMGSQSSNPYIAGQVLGWKDAHKEVDALAIAPYFGNGLAGRLTPEAMKATTMDAFLDELAAEVGDKNKKQIEDNAAIAKKYGLRLLAYEGGQHLVPKLQNKNDKDLVNFFIEANRNPRMKELYREHLQNWFAAGGDVYAVFSSMSKPSQHGSWGIKEYIGQPDEQAPKYQAVVSFIRDAKIQP